LLNEKSLHASLRAWYARPRDRFEVPIDGYVVDIVRGDLLVEIQTGHFAGIKSKLAALVRTHRVRLIYPIAEEKWIARMPRHGGGAATRRKSPRKGRIEDLFTETVHIPRLLSHRNFSLEVLMIREEEARRHDASRAWRRRGWVVEERRLLGVVDRRVFASPQSWLALLPLSTEPFTARDLAAAGGIGLALAQKMAYTLRKAGLVRAMGKRGRAILYRVDR